MKRLTLTSLQLENFRGAKNRRIDFGAGVTTIAGANGTGKSTVHNAFNWLLFGKDADERKDHEIRPILDGKQQRKIETAVTGVFDCDGAAIELRRVYIEDWVKPKGTAELVFKGNRTDCYWNGAPVSLSDYQSRVAGLVDSTVFKIVTNPEFFPQMKWQDQREQLFRLAGEIDDDDLAAKNPEYRLLLDKISGKPLADFKKELAARKRRLKEELATIQPRIDQTEKLMPEAVDLAAVAALEKEHTAKIADLRARVTDIAARERKWQEQLAREERKLGGLKLQLQKVVAAHKEKEQAALYAANAKRRKIEEQAAKETHRAQMAATAAANIEAQMAVTKEAAKELKAAVDALRQEWHAANAPQFEGGGNCPVCGQPLPDSEVAKARQAFEKGKAEKLAAITARGKDAAGRFEETKATLEHLAADLAARRKEAAEAEQFAALAQSELRAVPEAESGLPDVEQTPEYCALYNSIQCAEGNAKRAPGLAQSNAGLVEKLRAEEAKAAAGLAACDSLRKQHGTRIEYQGIIAELEERALELGQLIADAEKDEFTMAQYTKARVAECERKINGLFSEVSFRLYNTTIDGGEVETCEALVRGVPYSVANSAGKIAAGLDIITALQKFHGVAAPIFIDGAESVNKFPPMLSQMILLTVSDDPELVITSQQ